MTSNVTPYTTPIVEQAGEIHRDPLGGEPTNVGAVYSYGGKWIAFVGQEPGVEFTDWHEATDYVVRRDLDWEDEVYAVRRGASWDG
jgi:hypothetical protein